MRRHTFTPETEKRLVDIEAYLISRYTEVRPEWNILIELLGDELDLYDACKQKIEELGLFNTTNYKKNPLIATLKDLNASISKKMQKLGISPYDLSRIKCTEEDDTVDFVEDLIS